MGQPVFHLTMDPKRPNLQYCPITARCVVAVISGAILHHVSAEATQKASHATKTIGQGISEVKNKHVTLLEKLCRLKSIEIIFGILGILTVLCFVVMAALSMLIHVPLMSDAKSTSGQAPNTNLKNCVYISAMLGCLLLVSDAICGCYIWHSSGAVTLCQRLCLCIGILLFMGSLSLVLVVLYMYLNLREPTVEYKTENTSTLALIILCFVLFGSFVGCIFRLKCFQRPFTTSRIVLCVLLVLLLLCIMALIGMKVSDYLIKYDIEGLGNKYRNYEDICRIYDAIREYNKGTNLTYKDGDYSVNNKIVDPRVIMSCIENFKKMHNELMHKVPNSVGGQESYHTLEYCSKQESCPRIDGFLYVPDNVGGHSKIPHSPFECINDVKKQYKAQLDANKHVALEAYNHLKQDRFNRLKTSFTIALFCFIILLTTLTLSGHQGYYGQQFTLLEAAFGTLGTLSIICLVTINIIVITAPKVVPIKQEVLSIIGVFVLLIVILLYCSYRLHYFDSIIALFSHKNFRSK